MNLHRFIGLALNDEGVCQFVAAVLCGKGSLSDVLENEIIKLDWNFRNMVIRDLVHVSKSSVVG